MNLETLSYSNLFIGILLLFAMAACLYTIYTVDSYQDRINDYWKEQLAHDPCIQRCNIAPANITYTLKPNENPG